MQDKSVVLETDNVLDLLAAFHNCFPEHDTKELALSAIFEAMHVDENGFTPHYWGHDSFNEVNEFDASVINAALADILRVVFKETGLKDFIIYHVELLSKDSKTILLKIKGY